MTAENPEWRQSCLPGADLGRSSLLQNIDSLTSRTDRLLKDRK